LTVKSCSQGHEIEYDFNNHEWVYSDTKESIATIKKCVKCKCKPTKEGYDSCLGFLPNVSSACCGHGKNTPFAILKTGEYLEFDSIKEMKKYFS
jgi:hypothetical protein